jgi:hypothetical protein
VGVTSARRRDTYSVQSNTNDDESRIASAQNGANNHHDQLLQLVSTQPLRHGGCDRNGRRCSIGCSRAASVCAP